MAAITRSPFWVPRPPHDDIWSWKFQNITNGILHTQSPHNFYAPRNEYAVWQTYDDAPVWQWRPAPNVIKSGTMAGVPIINGAPFWAPRPPDDNIWAWQFQRIIFPASSFAMYAPGNEWAVWQTYDDPPLWQWTPPPTRSKVIAVTTWTPTPLAGSDAVDLAVYQWGPGVTAGDILLGLARGDLRDRSIQVEGTFGGATVSLLGSNDATTNSNGNYHQLTDPKTNSPIALTAAGICQVLEITAWMKPALSGATGSTSLTITTCQRLR